MQSAEPSIRQEYEETPRKEIGQAPRGHVRRKGVDPFRKNKAELSNDMTPGVEYIEHLRTEREYDQEAFDRLLYAKQLLQMLKVRRRVALCIGGERLHVEQGGLPGFPEQKPWAILSIPPDASRAHIALTIAQLAQRARDPFLLDVLLRVRPT